MNPTLEALARVCREKRIEEKVLLVPSHAVGHQVGEALSRAGVYWLNLRCTTVAGLAEECAFPEMAALGLRRVDAHERALILERLLWEDEGLSGPGCYFGEASSIPGVVRALGRAVQDLRMAGLGPEDVRVSSFVVREKGEALQRLLRGYETFLEENRLVDEAGLLRTALEGACARPGNEGTVFLVLSGMALSSLERRFVERVSGGSARGVEEPAPAGLPEPRRLFGGPGEAGRAGPPPKTDLDLMRWLFAPGEPPPAFEDGSVALFHAAGESNEVREVLRPVLARGVPFDDVEILHTREVSYASLVHALAGSLDVPVTFAGGIPVTHTRPGRAVLLFLEWWAGDFPQGPLLRLLAGGGVDFGRAGLEGEAPSFGKAAALVREAGIGWGRDRYARCLGALERTLREKAAEKRAEGEVEAARWTEGRADQAAWVGRLVAGLLEAAPVWGEEEGPSLEGVCQGAVSFLERFSRVAGEEDAEARNRLMETLGNLGRSWPSAGASEARVIWLRQVIEGVSVGRSSPRPGHLHVGPLGTGGYSGRGHTFVVGLDQGRFPGVPAQDPVLLDPEREALGEGLLLSGEAVEESRHALVRCLGSLSGRLCLSCSCRDLSEDREVFPSSVLLNAYRLVTNDREGDYEDLARHLGPPAGFVPWEGGAPLNDWEWWLSRGGTDLSEGAVLEAYAHLGEGRRAEAARAGDRLTGFDGWVPSARGHLDPAGEGAVLSSSRLEALAKCPFRFFLEHVLGLEPLEEMERDPFQWLEPRQRGNLLHAVFCRFMEELGERGERPRLPRHLGRIEALALEEVERWKEEIPPATDLVAAHETRDVLRSVRMFLQDEEGHCRRVEPAFFELDFGQAEGRGGRGGAAPVEVTVPGAEAFRLRGRIDRVDRVGEGAYEIWDYKTGQARDHLDPKAYRQGRVLQHALYALAAERVLEERLGRGARVVRSGYFFASPRGEGERIARGPRDWENLGGTLSALFELMRGGVFPAAYEDRFCRSCDYRAACGGKDAVARTRGKLEDDPMAPLRRLKDGR